MSEWRKIDGIENYEFSFNGKDALCKSFMEAGKILNKSQGFISSCCRGEKVSTEYIFKYV